MEYPKYIYLKQENKPVLVKNSAEEARYGQEGADYAQRQWPENEVIRPEKPIEASPDCPSCAGLQKSLAVMTAKFDKAFGQVVAERDEARAERDEFKKRLEAAEEAAAKGKAKK